VERSQPIDEDRLETDPAYRYAYLASFVGLSDLDLAVIRGAREMLEPHLDGLVDELTQRVLDFEPAGRHFLNREGVLDRPAITAHLRGYLERLLSEPGEPGFGTYLDDVGAVHRPGQGAPTVDVPQVQMNALLGFIADAMVRTIAELGLPIRQRLRAIRAFNKLLWIQNDLIGRHYPQE
jgi:hypothetical protein